MSEAPKKPEPMDTELDEEDIRMLMERADFSELRRNMRYLGQKWVAQEDTREEKTSGAAAGL